MPLDIKFSPFDYLGDGVYIRHDGYHIWLHLHVQELDSKIEPADRGIALEPAVFDKLVAFKEKMKT